MRCKALHRSIEVEAVLLRLDDQRLELKVISHRRFTVITEIGPKRIRAATGSNVPRSDEGFGLDEIIERCVKSSHHHAGCVEVGVDGTAE